MPSNIPKGVSTYASSKSENCIAFLVTPPLMAIRESSAFDPPLKCDEPPINSVPLELKISSSEPAPLKFSRKVSSV